MKNNNNINKNVNSVDTNDNKNNNGDDFMKNNIYTSQKDSTSGRGVENENGFNTNNNLNKSNGDDHMKLLTKKQFKGLRKGQAYGEYKSVGELAEAFKHKADVAETLFRDAKIDAEAAKSLLNDAKTEAENAKKRAELAEKKADEAELRATMAEGKSDAGLDIISQMQEDLDELIENRDETFGNYKRINERMGGKKNRANINTGTIRHYTNIIRQCKKDIEKGINVGVNKATIIELEAEIRNLQRQVDAANSTFHEMKRNKIVLSEKIDKMDTELNKRYQLQGLLGELGYI